MQICKAVTSILLTPSHRHTFQSFALREHRRTEHCDAQRDGGSELARENPGEHAHDSARWTSGLSTNAAECLPLSYVLNLFFCQKKSFIVGKRVLYYDYCLASQPQILVRLLDSSLLLSAVCLSLPVQECISSNIMSNITHFLSFINGNEAERKEW